MRFRKKPVIIEAIQLNTGNLESVAEWCSGSLKGVLLARSFWVIEIDTLEGQITARVGDWVIRGINGEFYPCKSDIFEKTYERVEE